MRLFTDDDFDPDSMYVPDELEFDPSNGLSDEFMTELTTDLAALANDATRKGQSQYLVITIRPRRNQDA